MAQATDYNKIDHNKIEKNHHFLRKWKFKKKYQLTLEEL